MKIYAIPRYEAQRIKDSYKEASYNIISVNDPEDPFLFPVHVFPSILSLKFHDINKQIPYFEGRGVLFNEEMAEQVIRFLDNLDTSKDLIVHCFAGICRSGAIAEFANEYLYDKGVIGEEDRNNFAVNNPHIMPNALVLSKLSRVLWERKFGEID